MKMSFAGYVSYPTADGTVIRSYLVVPPGGTNLPPGVLILRGVAGPDDGYVEIANRFAEAGYAVLVHGWLVRGNDPSQKDVAQDVAAALAYMAGHSDIRGNDVAVVGYCRGGEHGVIAASGNSGIRALVLVHGMSKRRSIDNEHPCHPVDLAGRIKCPVLILHGGADEVSPLVGMKELATLFMSSEKPVLNSYERAPHGFAVRTHPGYVASAAEDAHSRTIEFLHHQLPLSLQR